DNRRKSGAGRRVVDGRNGRMTALEIIRDPVALDRHPDPDRDHSLALCRIAIYVIHGLPFAIRQRSDSTADGFLDIILHRAHALKYLILAVFPDEAQDLAFGHRGRARLRVDIADDRGWIARVLRDHFGDVVTEFARAKQTHRRDPDRLAEHVPGGNVEGPRHRAAQIRPVTVRLRKADQIVIVEDRAHKADVREMRTARIGIVDGVDIAGQHFAGKDPDDILAGEMQRSDMNGDILIALRNRIALG